MFEFMNLLSFEGLLALTTIARAMVVVFGFAILHQAVMALVEQVEVSVEAMTASTEVTETVETVETGGYVLVVQEAVDGLLHKIEVEYFVEGAPSMKFWEDALGVLQSETSGAKAPKKLWTQALGEALVA